MPTISIFIPLYNTELFIQKTIESVLSQTFQDWELFIIDDCSKDNSYAVAKAFELKDKRIKVYKNETNLGMMGNWNKGIELCHSDYFVKLDADDVWHPTMLEKSVSVLENNDEVGLVFTRYININTEGEELKNTDVYLPEFASNKAFSCVPIIKQGAYKMFSYPILRQGLSVIRRRIFNEIGNYKNIQSSDTEFYFRVGLHYKIFCIDEVLYYYRIHPNSDSLKIANEGLREFLLYEVRNHILQYYFEQGAITKAFYCKQIKSVELMYNFFRSYKSREEQKYFISLKWMLRNFYLAPLTTIKFYIGRL